MIVSNDSEHDWDSKAEELDALKNKVDNMQHVIASLISAMQIELGQSNAEALIEDLMK
jgi:hypothetical protein